MATQLVTGEAREQAFLARAIGDAGGAVACVMCTIGDRLGLFRELAENGSATSEELARRADVDARYTREWLAALASAGYLEFDPASGRFSLPPEHVAVLADEGSPVFMGAIYEMLPGLVEPLDKLVEAFRHGGCLAQDELGEAWWRGMTRFTSSWFDNLLVQEWIPALPEVQARLERGVDVADVGCGRGRALIRLAEAFPNSRYVGYDKFASSLTQAAAEAAAAGVAERVRFEQADVAADGLPAEYDLITTFDVTHDAPDPRGLVRAIRRALRPDGTYLLLEINAPERLQDAGPVGTMLYSLSVLCCMPTTGGEGLGVMGIPEPVVRKLCSEAGFATVERLPIEHPWCVLYEVRP